MVGVVVILPTTVCWCSVDVGGNDVGGNDVGGNDVGVSVGIVIGIGGGVIVSGDDGNDDCGGVVGLGEKKLKTTAWMVRKIMM